MLVKSPKYKNLDEAIIFPLVSDPTYELSPSSSINATILYRDYRTKQMLNIALLVRECCKKNRLAATVKSVDQFNGIILYSDWFRPFTSLFDELTRMDQRQLEDFWVCKEIECFYEALKLLDNEINLLGLFERRPLCSTYLEIKINLLNRFFKLIRECMSSPEVKLAIQKRTQQSVANLKCCRKLINASFKQWSKLLVLRIDFGFKIPNEILKQHCYSDDFNNEFHSLDKLVLLKELLGKFLNNRRHNSKFEKIVAYILKFEHGFKKGFHAHAIFILNCNECQNDSYYAYEFTKYWEKLTNGNGCTYNCQMVKQKYKRLGIGMINYHENEKRIFLDQCLQYLCKADQTYIFKRLNSSEYRSIQKSQGSKKLTNARHPHKPSQMQKDESSVTKGNGGK